MGSHMKTTIEIADAVLEQGQRLARQEHVTLRALVEEGLRKVVEEHEIRRKPFKLRPVKFLGGGFQPGLDEGNWEKVRELVYKTHGS